jgi:hypothetical protein
LYSNLTCTSEVIDLTTDDEVEIKEEVDSEPVGLESGTTDRQESLGTMQTAGTKRTRTDEREEQDGREQEGFGDGAMQTGKRRCISV